MRSIVKFPFASVIAKAVTLPHVTVLEPLLVTFTMSKKAAVIV
ncbi:MAG: hypothetical protein WCA77_08190 [Thermoplasmata archaeon]